MRLLFVDYNNGFKYLQHRIEIKRLLDEFLLFCLWLIFALGPVLSCVLKYFVEFALLSEEALQMDSVLVVAVQLNISLLLALAIFIVQLLVVFV